MLWDAIKFGAELAWNAVIEILKVAVIALTFVITGFIQNVITFFK